MTAWHDLGFVGRRTLTVPDLPVFRTQRNGLISETSDCEGSSMPREARKVEPGQVETYLTTEGYAAKLRKAESSARLDDDGSAWWFADGDGTLRCKLDDGLALTVSVDGRLECPACWARVERTHDAQDSLRNKATSLVDGQRQDDYGEPVYMHAQVAQAWAAVFGWDVDNHKVALAMALVKIVREAHKHKPDNLVDATGYLDIAGRCADE